MIEVRNLHFSYDGTQVLRGISCNINSGEIFGILGPNGAGKTTLLKLIGGLLKQQGGEITIDGSSFNRYSRREIAKKIAYVPQVEEIFLPFSVEQIVLMGRSPYIGRLGFEGKRDLDVAHRAMESTDVWDLRGRTIQELSGGERQRVILARALAQETPILLLDEPTSHLDIRYQMEILEICSTLNREQEKTIVMTLHDINLSSLFCHRLALIKEGVVSVTGTPDEVITESNIKSAYGVNVLINQNPKTGRPSLLPIR